MPGRPMLRKLATLIEEQGGDSVVLDRIADGETITKIAKSYDVSRRMIYDWIHLDAGREKAWAEAKVMSADALVDEAAEVLDNVPAVPTNADVSLADKKVQFKKWLASKRDAEQYGDEKQAGVEVTLNLGELHLNALREAGAMRLHPKNRNVIESVDNGRLIEADYEVVEQALDIHAELMEDD